MSGQVVMDTLLPDNQRLNNDSVPWHTSEITKTNLFSNDKVCPKLNEIEMRWKTSPAFFQWNHSTEHHELDNQLKEAMGTYTSKHLFDCFMTSQYVLYILYTVKMLTKLSLAVQGMIFPCRIACCNRL